MDTRLLAELLKAAADGDATACMAASDMLEEAGVSRQIVEAVRGLHGRRSRDTVRDGQRWPLRMRMARKLGRWLHRTYGYEATVPVSLVTGYACVIVV